MDALMSSLFSEEGLCDSIFMDQCDFMDSINEEFAAILGGEVNHTLCSESPLAGPGPGPEQWQTNRDRAPIVLNFGDPILPENIQQVNFEDDQAHQGAVTAQLMEPTKRAGRARPASQTYDHIVAERKRRELLNQRFATLAAMVPGITKRDKISVLKDATKYFNQLQDRVQTLEEETRKETMESLVLVKKSYITDSCEAENHDLSEREHSLPEIEARLCNNHILLKIQCERIKGVLVKLFDQVEKLNLTVVSSNVLPFGNLALDITIVTQVETGYSVSQKEIVRVVHSALQHRTLKY